MPFMWIFRMLMLRLVSIRKLLNLKLKACSLRSVVYCVNHRSNAVKRQALFFTVCLTNVMYNLTSMRSHHLSIFTVFYGDHFISGVNLVVNKSSSYTTECTRWPTPPPKKYLAPGLKWSLPIPFPNLAGRPSHTHSNLPVRFILPHLLASLPTGETAARMLSSPWVLIALMSFSVAALLKSPTSSIIPL